MIKKLVKYGNSHALVIDKPIMDLLNISQGTPLEISTPDGSTLVIKPIRQEVRDSLEEQPELAV